MPRWFVNEGDVIRANLISNAVLTCQLRTVVVRADGSYRRDTGPVFTTNGTRTTEIAVTLSNPLPDGEIVAMNLATFTANVKRGAFHAQVYVIEQPTLAQGYVYAQHDLLLGVSDDFGIDAVGFDRTYIFQGTVAEDGTVGTHTTSLTVTPGAGNEILVMGGHILDGNTATAQSIQAFIDDGTNIIMWLANPEGITATAALLDVPVPVSGNVAVSALNSDVDGQGWAPIVISGTMRLVLRVITTAISVTQTFAVALRVRGRTNPTFVLADSLGTPVLTTNTSAEF